MSQSIFTKLCDIADALDRVVRDLAAGPQRDTLEGLLHRLDEVIDRTVGVTEVHQPHPDQASPRP
jgi:hypothetical protein